MKKPQILKTSTRKNLKPKKIEKQLITEKKKCTVKN